jgi:hypothetical protein
MRAIWTVLLLAGATTSAFALGNSMAGRPALDPRSMRGTQTGPITQVLNLGSDHLAQRDKKPTAAELDGLLDKLEAFRPEIITHEGLSGEQCDQVERYKARYPGIFDDYCNDTKVVEKSTGLTVPKAMEEIETTLKSWPKTPAAADRRKLAALFLAANDRPSALVQWLRLSAAERKLGDGIDQPLFDMLEKAATRPNETIVIGVALAVRLGHERIFAVDDHTADSIQGAAIAADAGFGPALQAHWKSGGDDQSPAMQRFTAAQKSVAATGDYLAYYRLLNLPETQRFFIELDYGRALKMPGTGLYGRQYVAWWETRNLRMVANIRTTFGNRPGARVLNIVGASHKPYYDAYLDMMSDVQIVDVAKVLR